MSFPLDFNTSDDWMLWVCWGVCMMGKGLWEGGGKGVEGKSDEV